MTEEDFYTFREYMKKEENDLTPSMEDYLEMICRLSKGMNYTRIHDLASALNVQPPSATRMVQKLSDAGFVNYEKYGVIILKKKGHMIGNMLLKRHNTVEAFIRLLGISEGVLEETEKIEHTLSPHTLEYIEDLVRFLKGRPEIIEEFEIFKRSKGNEE